MKNKIIVILLIISLGVNLYMLGKWIFYDLWYKPSPREEIILSEMVQKTVQSKQYQYLAALNKVIAIDTHIDRNKGGVFPSYFSVFVRTDEKTYKFYCDNKECSEVAYTTLPYSIYEDESPKLPFAETE